MGSPDPVGSEASDPRPLALVVDDDRGMLTVISSALKTARWRVRTLSRGDLVVEAAREERPNIVLLDVQMPGADGFTVLAHLRADPALRDVRVVFVSGEPGDVHGPIAKDLGADGFLEKPFRLEKLFALLNDAAAGAGR